jgi:hypothetical protein
VLHFHDDYVRRQKRVTLRSDQALPSEQQEIYIGVGKLQQRY